MIRRTYIDARGEDLRVDELHDHEMYDQGNLHDLIHAVAVESVTITYKEPMSRNGVDGILHIQYEGFYPPEHDLDEEHELEDLGYGGEPCGNEEE